MATPSDWSVDGPVLLLLLARGLEDVALQVLRKHLDQHFTPDSAHLHCDSCLENLASCPRRTERFQGILPVFDSHRWTALSATKDAMSWPCALPNGEEGEAYVGKLLLNLDGFSTTQRRSLLMLLMDSGLFQGILAFLTAADNIESHGQRSGRGQETSFHGSLHQLEELVANSPRWTKARELHREAFLLGTRTDPTRNLDAPFIRFRASCVRDGKHTGFRSQDAMAAIGAGTMTANEDFEIDLYGYDLEVLGLLSGQCFACGLWLGAEWRVNPRGEVYGGAERNFHCVPVGDRRCYLPHDVRNLPRLRPSTALLMLHLANPGPGELLLDPFGGVGTIAVEAACRFPALMGISSDKDPSACHTAAMHCQLAKKLGLQPGSSLETRKWDARKLKLEPHSVDFIVSDLPFLNRCDFDFQDVAGNATSTKISARQGLAQVLRSFAKVLRPQRRTGGPGLAILLVQSRHILEDALRYSDHCLRLQESAGANPRPVVIGGAACWIFILEKDKASATQNGNDAHDAGLMTAKRGRFKVFRQRSGAPPPSYLCRSCQRPGHWRDRCPILPRTKAELLRRATF
eukprot:symbB.v1.2.008155.t1/scaffold510.1/size193565/5